MTADAMEHLLAVQATDTHATQLRTRRQGLPERAEAVEVAAALRGVQERQAAVDDERHRLDRDQARLEDEIAGLRAKSVQADQALYSGTVTNPRELKALQDDLASRARRIAELEDRELELLVEREPVDAATIEVAAERAVLEARAAELAARITAAEAEIDVELDRVLGGRAEVAASVPADLLAEYEELRAANGGIGVARLEHGTTCGGCHLQLSAMERDRIRGLPDDTRVHCEECGRLLVR
ncbi:MAG TPA: C4-type zinc ribbon domain-containing protein [Acidimicrobiales bacterium]|nr:C4-type zinc ribbon domain-containing protein [Acidimicrobiales bacterium]